MYVPHSNECGPRALLAAAIYSLHPNPNKNSLIPAMHPNIAQISRWWVAKSILTQDIDTNNLRPLFHTTNDHDLSSPIYREAIPYNLAPLDHHINGTSSFNPTTDPLLPPISELVHIPNKTPTMGNDSSSPQTQESLNILNLSELQEDIDESNPSPYNSPD
jgi:hypothetical protein